MANLKIKVGAATSTPMEIQRLRRARRLGYSNIRSVDYSTYEKASNQFDPTITGVDGILFLFDKTSVELKDISDNPSNSGKIIFNINGTYSDQIKKIEVTTLKNKFIFPNGNQLLYPIPTINYAQDIAGIAGEYGFGTRTIPTKSQNDVIVYPVAALTSGTVVDFFAEIYEPICLINGHKHSDRDLVFQIRLLDSNNNPLTIKTYEYFGSPLQSVTSSLATTTNLGASSRILEKKYNVAVDSAVVIKKIRLDIIDIGNDGYIKIENLPTYGALKLNGVDVTIGQVVGFSDINSGKLIYTPNTVGVVDFISFTNAEKNIGETSWVASMRVFYFNITTLPE